MPGGAGRSGGALTGRRGIDGEGGVDGEGGIQPWVLPCPPSVPPHGRRLHPPTPPCSHLAPKGRRRAPSRVMWPGLPLSSAAACALESLAWLTLEASQACSTLTPECGHLSGGPGAAASGCQLSCAQLCCFCPQGDFRAAHRTSTAMKCELLASRLKPRNQTAVEGKRGRS